MSKCLVNKLAPADFRREADRMTGARAPRRMLALALALEGPKPGAAVRAGPQPPADAPTVATKGRRSFSVTLDRLRMLWARAELAWRDETDPGRGASDPAGCLAQEPWPFPPSVSRTGVPDVAPRLRTTAPNCGPSRFALTATLLNRSCSPQSLLACANRISDERIWWLRIAFA
jgi:hypothetical protein